MSQQTTTTTMSDAARYSVSTGFSQVSTHFSQARELWKQEPVPFVTFYILTGLLALLAPAIKYRREVKKYHNSYYYQYQQYNEQQNGSGDQNGDGGDGVYDINNCKWWNFRCTPVWVNENGEYVEQEGQQQQQEGENGNYYSVPSWFSGWGGNNNNRSGDSREGQAASSGALKFVYAWQTILFLALLAYGALLLFQFRGGLAQSRMAIQSLFLLIFLWSNFCFLSMWMLANGSIYTEGREIEELGGFYLQFSVLMFLTNFWQFIWGLCFCIALGIRSCRKPKASGGEGEHASVKTGESAPDSDSYFPYCEPTISVTNSNANTNTEDNQNKNSSTTNGKSYSFV